MLWPIAAKRRSRGGTHLGVVATSGGASPPDARQQNPVHEARTEDDPTLSAELRRLMGGSTLRLAMRLDERTGLEVRAAILGHVQRGGTPSAGDGLLAARLGTACAAPIEEGVYGVMIAARAGARNPSPWQRWQANAVPCPPTTREPTSPAQRALVWATSLWRQATGHLVAALAGQSSRSAQSQ